jgi:protein-disulfide isomerase
MTMRWRWMSTTGVVGVMLAMASIGAAQPSPAQPAPAQSGPAPKEAAATIGNEVIMMTDLEKSTAGELASLDEQRYRILERRLTQMIGERLLTREAQRRGVSVEALLHAEVSSKTPPVTGDDVNAFIAQNRARLPQGNDADLKPKVADYLYRLQLNQRTEGYVASLRAQTPVQVYLKPPEPVRVQIDQNVGFARGPREAPVTIVEFSDFQCPFCKTVVATLKQIVAQYPDRVRWVFRDFPIAGLHPEAHLAHEAARCAADQDKFWAYHDLLFERGPDVSPAALRAYAAQAGVEPQAFSQCLDSHKHRAAVNADVEAGTKLGVSGTPTFFVNGALLVGNQPLAEFQRIIERELGRTAKTTR